MGFNQVPGAKILVTCCPGSKVMLLGLPWQPVFKGKRWDCLKIVYPKANGSWSLSLLNGYHWGYTLFSDKPYGKTGGKLMSSRVKFWGISPLFFGEKFQMTSKTEEKNRKDVGRKRDGESTALRCFVLSQYSLSQPKTDSTCQVKNISIGKIHQQSIGSVSN